MANIYLWVVSPVNGQPYFGPWLTAGWSVSTKMEPAITEWIAVISTSISDIFDTKPLVVI